MKVMPIGLAAAAIGGYVLYNRTRRTQSLRRTEPSVSEYLGSIYDDGIEQAGPDASIVGERLAHEAQS